MDAKVDDWVVTPRRGKAVKINALWYNALRLTGEWLDVIGDKNTDRARLVQQADLAYTSFQKRFWNTNLNCLYDVVDSPEERDGQLVNPRDDSSIRPNQVIALALKYPVLAEEKWKAVLEIVRQELLTPVGLRSLSPRDEAYKAKYDGDLAHGTRRTIKGRCGHGSLDRSAMHGIGFTPRTERLFRRFLAALKSIFMKMERERSARYSTRNLRLPREAA